MEFNFSREAGEFGNIVYTVLANEQNGSVSFESVSCNSISGKEFVEGTELFQSVMSKNFSEELKTNEELYEDVLQTYNCLKTE